MKQPRRPSYQPSIQTTRHRPDGTYPKHTRTHNTRKTNRSSGGSSSTNSPPGSAWSSSSPSAAASTSSPSRCGLGSMPMASKCVCHAGGCVAAQCVFRYASPAYYSTHSLQHTRTHMYQRTINADGRRPPAQQEPRALHRGGLQFGGGPGGGVHGQLYL